MPGENLKQLNEKCFLLIKINGRKDYLYSEFDMYEFVTR